MKKRYEKIYMHKNLFGTLVIDILVSKDRIWVLYINDEVRGPVDEDK